MKKEIYEAVEQFFNQLPLPQEVSDCWQNVTKEIPLPADIVVLMDDMYDTVGMASRLLYRMRENNIRVPLFYILGGNNRLLNQNDALVLQATALKLGIKYQNIRMYQYASDWNAKLEILNAEAAGKKVVFVTSRLGYLPLRKSLERSECLFSYGFNVAYEKLEDALTWVNANAAAGGLALLRKICRLYQEEDIPELLLGCGHYTFVGRLRVKFSVWQHRRSIKREREIMIRSYQRQFRRRNWAY